MQGLKYNLYVFSMERGYPGTIIANRSRQHAWLAGNNFFRTLKISKSEESFFQKLMYCDNIPAVVVLSGGRTPHAIVIYNFLLFDLAYFIAVEYVMPPELPLKILYALCSQCAEFSPNVMKALQESDDAVFDEKLHKSTYLDIFYLSGLLTTIGNFATVSESVDVPKLHDVFESIAEIVGTEFDISVKPFVPRPIYLPAQVFSGAAAVATAFVLAMITRIFSSDNTLYVQIDGAILNFVIENTSGRIFESVLKHLQESVNSIHTMPFDFNLSHGCVQVAAMPAYVDEGVSSEVKNDQALRTFLRNSKKL